MSPPLAARLPAAESGTVGANLRAVLDAMGVAVLVLDGRDRVVLANAAAEELFMAGALRLIGAPLAQLVPPDSPLVPLVGQVRAEGGSRTEYDLSLETPRIGSHMVTVQAGAVPERPGEVVVALHGLSVARRIDQQLTHRNAARQITGLAAMLAHEVKNPLSGIRGAAQLLEQSAGEDERELTRLICEETDRICALVDRVEAFTDSRPMPRAAVNIHEVLDRVRRIAEAGFARGIAFEEAYDPSLPPVLGNRDLLIQVFLNLVKNAAEAAPAGTGRIELATSFQHGVRIGRPGGGGRVHLPIVVSVADNGSGVPEDLRAHLFDPFVTTKSGTGGLGLALVAKLVGDHGGIVEFDSETGRTVFRVMLSVAEERKP